jgi:glycosyltransferase involved in cell wall biosynthesis
MEGFGMAACEAAASGVPVVGTKLVPVLTDIIAPAGGGIVVDAGDVAAAARAIGGILCMDKDSHAAMCDKAYRSVVPKFSWEEVVQSMFDQVQSKGVEAIASSARATNGYGISRIPGKAATNGI